MDSKILANGAVATKPWRQVVGKALLFLLAIPLVALIVVSGVLWFVSLGHINLLGVLWDGWFDQLANKISPD